MEEPVSTFANVGASIKRKQAILGNMTHDYLIDNFHKFCDDKKFKLALSYVSKMAPQLVEGSHTVNKMTTIVKDGQPLEFNLGNSRTPSIN